jgi:mRNA-degrading endonuclease RelE of RelBE toxin-antitoxin system
MYRVILTTQAGRAYKKLPEQAALLVAEAIDSLVRDPFLNSLDIKKLKPPLYGYRLRIRDWRVLYTVEDNIIDIHTIKNRKDVYK